MILFNESNLSEIKKVLEEKRMVNVRKGNFVVEMAIVDIHEGHSNIDTSDFDKCIDIDTFHNGEFYENNYGILYFDDAVRYLNFLSEESKDFENYLLKQKIKSDIKEGKHKCLSLVKGHDKKLIKIYKEENEVYSQFSFLKLLEEINSNFKNEPFYVEDTDNYILVTEDMLSDVKLNNLFPEEVTNIKNILGKRICGYCDSTVPNRNLMMYTEFCGWVSKTHMCSECIDLYESDFYPIFTEYTNKDNITSIEKIDIIKYILNNIK